MGEVSSYLPNKLVTSVRDKIYDLTWALHIEQVASTLDEEEVEQDYYEGTGCRCAKNLWVKAFLDACLKGCYENVGHKSHDCGNE